MTDPRPTSACTIAVFGILGRSPYAGVAWQALHYLEGFRRLGHDVWYVEDTGDWPFDLERNTVTDDPAYTLQFLARVMTWTGFGDRWAYRAASRGDEVYGPAAPRLSYLLGRADALVNVTGATLLREEHLRIPIRIYLETDPVLAQLEVAQQKQSTIDALASHTHHFTFGENLGSSECWVPTDGFHYRPTRQPVIVDWWRGAATSTGDGIPRLRFTTVATWRQTSKDIQWHGRTLRWSKHEQFLKFIDLPQRSGQAFELAVTEAGANTLDLLSRHGWGLRDAIPLTMDILPYRDFIMASGAEFTVAKEQYVAPCSGWFSDRSASYLAAGKPVITQDTGFRRVLPTGRGLFAFRTVDDILEAIEAVATDYATHARAAREIADQHFAAEVVLGRLLAEAGL